jgi:uncharacterized protein YqjF (DUF2071 family)
MDDCAAVCQGNELSRAGMDRLLSVRGEPLLVADWDRVLMIHYEVDKALLKRSVPFELDLYQNRAFVSVVAFTIKAMRPFRGGGWTSWLLKPIATHEFLNVRTYVRSGSETGIYFLAEWLSNRLSVMLGPYPFGLPYRYGQLQYQHLWEQQTLAGTAVDSKDQLAFSYKATVSRNAEFGYCQPGSLEEWLMERYTAFTCRAGQGRFFRVWHPPWRQTAVPVKIAEQSLLEKNWPLFHSATINGANFSPAVKDVWMGRPHRVR